MRSFLKKSYSFLFKKHTRKTWASIALVLLLYIFCLPTPLFKDPTCMVLEDKNGQLLAARIAQDGQWRFPYDDNLPEKFIAAITTFEDKRFFYHWGIDPFGIARAFQQNLKNRRIVSGGSTITMQVMRLARKGKKRNILQKLIEMVQATRLEIKYSKNEILAFYASNAPFGGNVVGLDAAAWRYYAKSPSLLSWAEAATLAVLPNSPALIHPGRNRAKLLAKRNRLLKKLFEAGFIDQTSYELAQEESLPNKPHPLPRLAPHLLDRAYLENFSGKKNQITRFKSTLEQSIQKKTNQVLNRHRERIKANDIHNTAALVVEIETGNVVAYVGNLENTGAEHGEQVDVIPAPRSTGSILKPFLYALMNQEGDIVPNSLIPDIPTHLSGYSPVNFHKSYDGMVTAKKALIRSLNVPFIRMLQRYGLEKFHFELKKLGFRHINKPASHYGLPLVLGGAEASLWDITKNYVNMARTLSHFYQYNGRYDENDFRDLNYNNDFHQKKIDKSKLLEDAPFVSASASWLCFEAMKNVERPNSEGNWQAFQSAVPIAWKTGTSFGFRDAWAVGLNAKYAVGVWVGNADGEGRPSLIGVVAAAPILFDIIQQLPNDNWFDAPYDEMIQLAVCKQSGYRALSICEKDTIWATKASSHLRACPFHQMIHTDVSGKWQVNSDCELPTNMKHQSWFVLPPVEEHYYMSKNPNYQQVPPFRADCQSGVGNDNNPMQLIYPMFATNIYVPIDLDGEQSRVVFKVAHRKAATTIYWHLDEAYIGQTKSFHHFELNPSYGKHILTLVDIEGNRLEQKFEVIKKGK